MTWTTTADVDAFLDAAGPFLTADPIGNAVLLTETHFCSRHHPRPPAGRFGWWVEKDVIGGAFIQLPDHDPLCSPLAPAAAAALPAALKGEATVSVLESDVDLVNMAWRADGSYLTPRRRVAVLRLEAARVPRLTAEGVARQAQARDLPLLRHWFDLFRSRFPADPSDIAYVIDQPLAAGAIVIWEVGGAPVAMSSRTPPAGPVVRMGLAFQPEDGSAFADAALAAGCRAAAATGAHVIALAADQDSLTGYEKLGFVTVGTRVVLQVDHLDS